MLHNMVGGMTVTLLVLGVSLSSGLHARTHSQTILYAYIKLFQLNVLIPKYIYMCTQLALIVTTTRANIVTMPIT